MARKPNAPVGVCPCPVGKCSASKAPLFQFASSAKEAATARKAGRYYGRCPNHGWFGYDCAPAMQAYIREHGTLTEGHQWGSNAQSEEKPDASPPNTQSPPPPPTQSPPPPPTSKVSPPKPGALAPTTRPDVWNL